MGVVRLNAKNIPCFDFEVEVNDARKIERCVTQINTSRSIGVKPIFVGRFFACPFCVGGSATRTGCSLTGAGRFDVCADPLCPRRDNARRTQFDMYVRTHVPQQ